MQDALLSPLTFASQSYRLTYAAWRMFIHHLQHPLASPISKHTQEKIVITDDTVFIVFETNPATIMAASKKCLGEALRLLMNFDNQVPKYTVNTHMLEQETSIEYETRVMAMLEMQLEKFPSRLLNFKVILR